MDEEALPSVFAEEVLGFRGLSEKQKDILDALLPLKSAVAAATCNGAGKTTKLITGAALWHASTFPRSKTIITSGSWTQIETQLIPALHAHRDKFEGWDWNQNQITTPTGSFIRVFSTNDPLKAEGHHEDVTDPIDGPCMIIGDEAKAIMQAIFLAFDRCTWTRYFLASSPGIMQGEFYEAFHRNASLYRRFRIAASECPWIDKGPNSRYARVIAKWGEDHPFVRSTIFAEFMSDDGLAALVVSLASVQNCMESPPDFDPSGGRVAFCDFAGGGDENVLALREGNRVTLPMCNRERNEMAAVGKFIIHFRNLNLKPEQIYGDAGGAGKVMCSALAEAGWPINRVHNQSPPNDRKTYSDRAAEINYEGAKVIESGQCILPKDDEGILVAQLTTRRRVYTSKGTLDIESKPDMKNRGLPSPDRAEAVLGVLAIGGQSAEAQRWAGNWQSRERQERTERFTELSW